MSSYPPDRKNSGYSIRFIKALLESDAIREHGNEAVLLAVFIASREDRLHYTKPPMFWRAELMNKFAKGSPKDFIRVRNEAVQAGLLHHTEGTRKRPGLYWTLIPDWLLPRFEAFRKGNGTKSKRSEKGTEKGTELGTLSIPITHKPITADESVESVPSKRKSKPKPVDGSLPEFILAAFIEANGRKYELTAKRRNTTLARLKEPFFVSHWQTAIGKVASSPFCQGENDRGWKADFDWFVRPDSVTKIMEGKYDSSKSTSHSRVDALDTYEEFK